MKIKLLGKNLDDIRPLLSKYDMTECDGNDVDLIVTHGGDGALLGAQRDFPDIPKLPIRDAATAPTCAEHSAELVLEAFVKGKLIMHQTPVLEAVCGDKVLRGINDLVIHSQEWVSALRYRVSIDGEVYAREVVGDGLCFTGVHGSTAYYRSVTRGIFKVGVGLAFFNTTAAVDHLVLPETSVVTIEIIRGPGILVADNDPCKIPVKVGEKVVFRQTEMRAEIWGLDAFMCADCRTLRHRK